jgi:hypothetical protein
LVVLKKSKSCMFDLLRLWAIYFPCKTAWCYALDLSVSLVKFIIRVVLQYLFWSINIYLEKTRFSCFLKN